MSDAVERLRGFDRRAKGDGMRTTTLHGDEARAIAAHIAAQDQRIDVQDQCINELQARVTAAERIADDVHEALWKAEAERDAARGEIARLRGPLIEYKRGYGPGDGDSAVIEAGQHKDNAR